MEQQQNVCWLLFTTERLKDTASIKSRNHLNSQYGDETDIQGLLAVLQQSSR